MKELLKEQEAKAQKKAVLNRIGVFKGYFFLPPPVPVTPCVHSGIAYDDFAETVERIHDVFLVCFCASHRNFLPSPTWGRAWLMVIFYTSEGR